MTIADTIDAPRTDLIRMVKGEIRSDGDRRTLIGYAAMFNRSTVINSWEGNFREQIAPGAFARSIKNKGTGIKVLFNHGMDPSIGDKPLGRASTIQEDGKGLYVEVPLSRTSYNDDIIALLEDGAIDGMSFRFSVPTGGDTWDYPERGLPTRTLTEVNLAEFGPVTFPAYEATSAGVRARSEFSIWRSLPDSDQAAIFQIITSATRATSPAFDTDDDRPGQRNAPKDPAHGHSSEFHESAARALELIQGEIEP